MEGAGEGGSGLSPLEVPAAAGRAGGAAPSALREAPSWESPLLRKSEAWAPPWTPVPAGGRAEGVGAEGRAAWGPAAPAGEDGLGAWASGRAGGGGEEGRAAWGLAAPVGEEDP